MSDITKADRQRLADALRTATREELLSIVEWERSFWEDVRSSEIRAALALAVVDQMDAAQKFQYQRWRVNRVGDAVCTNLGDSSDTLPAALADFLTREGE